MSLTFGVKVHIHLLNVVVRFIIFLTSATLIFRGTDISKCFRESLGIRDNESRLYLISVFIFMHTRNGNLIIRLEYIRAKTKLNRMTHIQNTTEPNNLRRDSKTI